MFYADLRVKITRSIITPSGGVETIEMEGQLNQFDEESVTPSLVSLRRDITNALDIAEAELTDLPDGEASALVEQYLANAHATHAAQVEQGVQGG